MGAFEGNKNYSVWIKNEYRIIFNILNYTKYEFLNNF